MFKVNKVKSAALVTTIGILMSTSALAEGDGKNSDDMSYNNDNTEWHGGQKGAIDKLPDEGQVSLSATVDSVDRDDNSFIVRDETGETIDVHTNLQNTQLNEGDKVSISGEMQSEALGLGEEIVNAKVQVLSRR